MDIELFLLKNLYNLKIERIKKYDEIECNKNIAQIIIPNFVQYSF